MITISALIQKLSIFHPLKQTISNPDGQIFQVNKFRHTSEAFSEQTAYLISAHEASFLRTSSVQNVYIVFVPEEKPLPDFPSLNNVILFSEDTDCDFLYETIHQLLQTAARVAQAHYRLSLCLLNRVPMEEILQVGSELLENPLFLSDTSTRVLKFSDLEQLKQVDDELIQCVIEHGFVTSELFDKYNYASLLPMIENQEQAFHQKSEYSQKKERLIVKVIIDRRYFGWIVVLPCNRPFKDGDCEILDILTQVLSLELERNKIGFALSHRENLLMELLSGRITSLEEFKRRAEGFDWIPGEHFYVMAITFHPYKIPSNKERTITAYKNHLALIYPSYKAVCIGDTLLLLLETDDLDSITNNLSAFFKTYHLAAGCSEHFSNILQVNQYYEQAMEILRLGFKLYSDSSIYCYRDFYLPYVISILKKHGNINSFCLPEILELQRYDEKNNTSYIETLRAYLRFRNAITAAEYLHIHRNTMNYRLQKIDDLTHLKLNEGNDLFKIWFSLLILAYPS